MDLVKAAEALVAAYLEAASEMGLLPIAKVAMMAELAGWEEADGERD